MVIKVSRAAGLELPRACASTFNKYRPGAMSFSGNISRQPVRSPVVRIARVRNRLAGAEHFLSALGNQGHRRVDLTGLPAGTIVVDFRKNCQRIVSGERPAAHGRPRQQLRRRRIGLAVMAAFADAAVMSTPLSIIGSLRKSGTCRS